jgi:glycine/D-amino acid oxidase-like deaminating enzyme
VGGGFTGLWAALLAREGDPALDVVVLEAERVGSGASGRNGGFVSGSITHGLAHGAARWPRELPTLVRLGRENLAAVAAFSAAHAPDAGYRACGKSTVATAPHHLPALRAAADLARTNGEEVELLDAAAMRADVAGATYLGGLRQRSSYGLVDPARLALGLARAARARGVRIAEDAAVTTMRHAGDAVELVTARGPLTARRVLVATGGYPPPLRRLRHWVLPVYDYVLVTEPLPADRLAALRWPDRQGVTDAGNRFHYYRLTDDDRLLFGGYDAIYHRGNRVHPSLEQRAASHRLLARHVLETFPQLEGIRFTHRWGGVIDSTTRFTPLFGTAFDGRVAYAVGYTGLGVAASRFGAAVGLDLLLGRTTERTRLDMVRRRPIPFPPEPLRSLVVEVTQRALAREDETGRRGAWLGLLDRLGVGFNT